MAKANKAAANKTAAPAKNTAPKKIVAPVVAPAPTTAATTDAHTQAKGRIHAPYEGDTVTYVDESGNATPATVHQLHGGLTADLVLLNNSPASVANVPSKAKAAKGQAYWEPVK